MARPLARTGIVAPPADLAAHLRGAQVIHGALVLSVVAFALLAAALGPIGTPPAPVAGGLDAIALTAVALTVTGAASAFLLPERLLAVDPAGPDAQRIAAFRGARLLATALCEGPAMLWCVALLLSGNRWYLFAIGGLVALMAFHWPTRQALHDATGLRVGED